MNTKLHSFFITLTLLAGIHQAKAQQTTAFTYQGQLRDGGTNANGVYTMIFALYDSVSGGNQIGSTISSSPALANGLFTVNLDFGAGAFNGCARWLDITVTNGPDSQELTPRVQVLPSPYALYANSAGSVASGSWNESVSNYQGLSNVFLLSDGGTVIMGLFTNGDHGSTGLGVNGDLDLQGSLKLSSTNAIEFGGGNGGGQASMFSDGQGGIQINGNLSVNGTINGAINGAIPQMQVFNASGTFAVPNNVTTIMVEVWGGGAGGGGGGNGNGTYAGGNGGGGGGGAYGKDIISVTPGNNMAVTVGLGGTSGGSGSQGGGGGTSSLGSVSATGGEGGPGGGASSGNSNGGYGVGGNPGTSTAAIQIAGVQGGAGSYPNGGGGGNGQGGAGANGGAGGGAGGAFPGSFESGQSPGGGGAGGAGQYGTGNLGNSGAAGRVIVWW